MTRHRSQDPTGRHPVEGAPDTLEGAGGAGGAAPVGRQANLQWAAVIIVGLVIFALVLVFGSGTGGGLRDAPIGRHG
jgi:hypothetical protein